jgi:hypothetical protein
MPSRERSSCGHWNKIFAIIPLTGLHFIDFVISEGADLKRTISPIGRHDSADDSQANRHQD